MVLVERLTAYQLDLRLTPPHSKQLNPRTARDLS
jgi:hypothetical protein